MSDTIEPVTARIDQQQFARELVAAARAEGVELVGPDGLLAGLTKTVLETALEAEMTEHLGYEAHDVAGRDGGNSRNGTRTKTVLTEIGPVEIEVPRDRDASFEPVIVRKRQRRLDGIGVAALLSSLLTTARRRLARGPCRERGNAAGQPARWARRRGGSGGGRGSPEEPDPGRLVRRGRLRDQRPWR